MGNLDARLRTVAIVLAGGTGSRIGLSIPKQLLKVAGKPIIGHTLSALQNAPDIDEIVVLMAPGWVGDVERVVTDGGYGKVSRVLEGGTTRNETTRIALAALGDEDCNVLVHDAVRPLVDQRIIADCISALDEAEAVDVVIPSADTIVEIDGDTLSDIPSRERLRRGQTPQAFRASTIKRAYELALADPGYEGTDDCSAVLRYCPEVPIKVVAGSEHNIKVTHPIDMFIADQLFRLGSRMGPLPSSPEEYAERLAGTSMVVFGGSYGIGGDVVAMARGFGATVFSHSRSQDGCHVENPAHVEKALREAYDAVGRIDFVVVTAGLLRTGPLAETDDATIEEMLRVNYQAPVLIARAALPYLSETRGELLLFTSSSYTRGRSGYSLYSSAKAGMVNLTQALADEWAGLGVRVNCINPERTATPMRTRAFGEEPPDTLLPSKTVALAAIDMLMTDLTGHVIDVRRPEPSDVGVPRTVGEAERIAESLAAAETEAALEAREVTGGGNEGQASSP